MEYNSDSGEIITASQTNNKELRLYQLPRKSCLHSLSDLIVWICFSICHIGQLQVAYGSFWKIDHSIFLCLC